jgi:hypothetical protein
MSTTNLSAAEVMDWMAVLMNDAARSAYTYENMLPYLNMAIDECLEEMERHNVPCTDETAAYITLTAGLKVITPVESPVLPHYPFDLIEIRTLSERDAGSTNPFTPLHKRDSLNTRTPSTALLDYAWTGQEIHFVGAISDRELKLDYVKELIHSVNSEKDTIGIIGVKSYLAYKGASFCAKYVAENPERAKLLLDDADSCMDNILGISAKGRQSIVTRRRPFRSSMKSRRNF